MTAADLTWKQAGNCRNVPVETMFPVRGDRSLADAARKVCVGCPVKGVCLDYALDTDDPGIWAGTTHNQRKKMRRARREGAAAWVVRNYGPPPLEPPAGLMSDLRLLLALVGQAMTDVAS